MNKRINFIDIARGFAIIFIVIGHAVAYSKHIHFVEKFVYSFHVILFFILSGYLFKIKENEKFTTFVKNKFLRIMIPYFIWAVLFLIPYMILGRNVADSLSVNTSFDFKRSIIGILYGIGTDNLLKQNSPIWFLPALFSMYVIYYYVIKNIYIYSNTKKTKLLLLIPQIVISYLSVYFLKVHLPWGINTVLNLGIFFYIGYLLKDFDVFNNKKIKWYCIIPLLIIGILACYLNKSSVGYMQYNYGYFTLAIISSLCLSFVIIYISKLINKNKVLEYIGKNTMGILIFHKLIILVFQTKLGVITDLLVDSNIIVELVLSLLITAITIGASLIATEILRKIAPFTIGEKRYKKEQNTIKE